MHCFLGRWVRGRGRRTGSWYKGRAFIGQLAPSSICCAPVYFVFTSSAVPPTHRSPSRGSVLPPRDPHGPIPFRTRGSKQVKYTVVRWVLRRFTISLSGEVIQLPYQSIPQYAHPIRTGSNRTRAGTVAHRSVLVFRTIQIRNTAATRSTYGSASSAGCTSPIPK